MPPMKMGERMARLEQKMEDMDGKVEEIRTDLKAFISCADHKFATKLTEKIVYGLVGLILIAFVTKLLSLW